MRKEMRKCFSILTVIILISICSYVSALAASFSEKDIIKKDGALVEEQTSRLKPAHIGDTVSLYSAGNNSKPCYVEITLECVNYGKDAAAIVSDASFFNASPEVGKEYCIAYFLISMQSKDINETYSIDENDFEAISQHGQVYSRSTHSVAGLDDSAKIYSDGQAQFAVPIYIDENDIPILSLGGRIWFSLDDKSGSRATQVDERLQFKVEMPDDAFAIAEKIYIGMPLDILKKVVKIDFDVDPKISGKLDNGEELAFFEGVYFDSIGGKCSLLAIASGEEEETNVIAFIRGAYSTLASSKMLDDYVDIQRSFIKSFGKATKTDESWADTSSKKILTKSQGVASGLLNIRTKWKLSNVYIELNLDTDISQMGIINDDKPHIWIGYYDVTLAPNDKKK